MKVNGEGWERLKRRWHDWSWKHLRWDSPMQATSGHRWSWGFDLTNLDLPRVNWYWWDEAKGSLCFSYGNGNSDPVLRFEVTVRVPRWLASRLG